MTEIVVGIEQLLYLLEKEGIQYIKTDPGIVDPNYGNIITHSTFITWRRL